MAKVSVVVPIYNAERYLRQCLDSIINQTLTDIEIICVNDGSSDSSREIIEEYVKRDNRIKAIHKGNSGYGDSMNKGLDIAGGEYIGIVESDDYIEPNMLEELYSCAKKNDLDFCKCGFYFYYSRESRNKKSPISNDLIALDVFCPTEIKSQKKKLKLFGLQPAIWSAIYKRDFLTENNIRFNETPGASYQDTSFNFKVWALAKRTKLLKDCLIHYRQDNEGSSINSSGKANFICYEYNTIWEFLKGRDKSLDCITGRLLLDAYLWNFNRLSPEMAKEFALTMSRELANCPYEPSLYSWRRRKQRALIVKDPMRFYQIYNSLRDKNIIVKKIKWLLALLGA
ncbi:MAG: glycosyltransferase [Clostridia bacterium]|nr:glycosyltransferase [Clostridia bacterium]